MAPSRRWQSQVPPSVPSHVSNQSWKLRAKGLVFSSKAKCLSLTTETWAASFPNICHWPTNAEKTDFWWAKIATQKFNVKSKIELLSPMGLKVALFTWRLTSDWMKHQFLAEVFWNVAFSNHSHSSQKHSLSLHLLSAGLRFYFYMLPRLNNSNICSPWKSLPEEICDEMER